MITEIPRLGMGTWYLGEGCRPKKEEETALRVGLDSGISLIDTAEMYGDGAAERLVGNAIKGFEREKIYLVSKVYPHNAGRQRIFQACANSLRRLRTDYLDLYLLHWRGAVPLQETIDCMEELVSSGKIRRWGVSNLDVEDMQELHACKSGLNCYANQVLYHLGSRGIEYALIPWQREHGIRTMAYCPLAQAGRLRRGLIENPVVQECAKTLCLTPMQVLLGFVLQQPEMTAIPRTGTAAHMKLNAAMENVMFPPEIMNALNQAFPPPKHRVALDMQ